MIKLIAFVDGSNYSKSVCDHAAWVAVKLGVAVELIHVRGRRNDSSAPVDLSGSIGLGARTTLLEELTEQDVQVAKLDHKRGRAILDEARKTLLAAGVRQVSTLLRNDGIVETVQGFESGAGLIVIGKRGKRTESDESHLGSNFERVIRASHKPVLVASRSFKPIKRFLIAFDGGPSSIKAVEYLAGKQVFNNHECHLLQVVNPTTEVQAQLDSTADSLRDAGYTVRTTIQAGQVETTICEMIRNNQIDLLVMGAYGHSRIRNLIIGSTTTAMIRSCKIPVLLFR